MYTVDQLIEDFRSDVYDRADVDASGEPRDTLWSPADVLRYLNQAAAQWAKDTLFVRRNMTLNVTAGKANYYVGADVLEIVRASFTPGPDPTARPRALGKFDLDGGTLNDDYGVIFLSSYDIANREGVPRGVTLDYDPSFLRLYPIPSTDGFLFLNLTVYPTELQCGMPLPMTSPRDRHLVLLWMKHLAYQKQDADVQDLDRADSFRREYFQQVHERMYELDRVRRDSGVMTPRRF